jgi:hypothetical protein
MTKKRDLFREVIEGFDALAEERGGKRTLRTHAVKVTRPPKIAPHELTRVREAMKLSRGLFASYLRTNVRGTAPSGHMISPGAPVFECSLYRCARNGDLFGGGCGIFRGGI